jgi:hypothetical protein
MATKDVEVKVVVTVRDSEDPDVVANRIWAALDDHFAWGIKKVELA